MISWTCYFDIWAGRDVPQAKGKGEYRGRRSLHQCWPRRIHEMWSRPKRVHKTPLYLLSNGNGRGFKATGNYHSFFVFFYELYLFISRRLCFRARQRPRSITRKRAFINNLTSRVRFTNTRLVRRKSITRRIITKARPRPLSRRSVKTRLNARIVMFIKVTSQFLLPRLITYGNNSMRAAMRKFDRPILLRTSTPKGMILLRNGYRARFLNVLNQGRACLAIHFPLTTTSMVPTRTRQIRSRSSNVLPFRIDKFRTFPPFVVARILTLIPTTFLSNQDSAIILYTGERRHRSNRSSYRRRFGG